jgi:hypothetical protein
VGGMIGMERTIIQSLPRLNLVSLQKTAILFIVAFGITKTVSNYFCQISKSIWQKKFAFWMVLALPIRLFDTCSLMELFCKYSVRLAKD